MIRKEIFKVAAVAIFFLIFAYFFKSAEIISAQKTRDTNTAKNKTPILFDPYTDLDERLDEKIQLNELEATPKIAEAMKAQIIKARESGAVDEKGNPVFLRAAHPKAHCCITAEFTVRRDVPNDLSVGLFAGKGKSYRAWIRYSNSNQAVRDDKAAGARGMAIKLTKVKGEKIDLSLPEQSTQDFVLLSGPTFFVDDPLAYLKVFTEGLQSLPKDKLRLAGTLASSH